MPRAQVERAGQLLDCTRKRSIGCALVFMRDPWLVVATLSPRPTQGPHRVVPQLEADVVERGCRANESLQIGPSIPTTRFAAASRSA